MKKYVSIICCVLLLIPFTTMCVPTVFAQTSGDYEYVILDDGTAKITGYTGVGSGELTDEYGDIVIPAMLDGYTVTIIGENAFEGCQFMEVVTIPETVTVIEKWAFLNSRMLAIVNIPFEIQSIGYEAFCNTALMDISLPDNAALHIGEDAFYGTLFYRNDENWEGDFLYIGKHLVDSRNRQQMVGSLTVKEGTLTIADDALSATGYSEIILPESLGTIGSDVFYGCTNLLEIVIPQNVRFIGDNALDRCTHLQSIEVHDQNTVYTDVDGVLFTKDQTVLIQYPLDRPGMIYIVPDGVLTIGNRAFAWCTMLTEVVLPEGLLAIEKEAFRECANLKMIALPDTVKSLGDHAFDRCKALTEMEVPYGVTEIPSGLFWACNTLEVTIPQTVVSFGNEVFSYATVTVYGVKGSAAEDYVNNSRDAFSTLTFVEIPARAIISGDLTDDGVIDMFDALALYAKVSGMGGFSAIEKEAADYTGDGVIDMFDALKLYQAVSGQ